MPFNVMIQLCRVTRASKLFQRNFYLPLLKPLSPKDALRRHIITGKNLLGQRIEHYIPVLEEHSARVQRRKYRVKGLGKKRQRKRASMKYVTPFFDDALEYHSKLKALLGRKSKGKGQCYTYYVPDKVPDCTLVVPHRMERAIRDRDILDITIAQRSEKILVTLADGIKVAVPLQPYDGNAPLYKGEGWTKKDIEQTHHHGKETMFLARLFESKEQGVEEWELEMMRLANKRKKKMKGEGTADWKAMMAAAAENMDWDKFEEEAKQIVDEVNEPVEDEPIAMEVDDMEKTKNVNEKLKNAGPEVLAKLPLMPEIPELIKVMPEGVLTEIANVSGVTIQLKSSGKECFVAGQVVKSEEGEIFMPGQTLEKEGGGFEYTPGFTVLMDNEPTLLPGLVMGDDPQKPMFLPGESTISESGQLQFTATEEDVESESESEPEAEPEPEVIEEEEEEEELDEEQNSEDEKVEIKRPPRKEFKYERPKRKQPEEPAVKRREKPAVQRKVQTTVTATPVASEPVKPYVSRRAIQIDMNLPEFEKSTIEQEKERIKKLSAKKSGEEREIDRKRREIILKAKQVLAYVPPPPKYVPLEPVKKSAKLTELEKNIKNGSFFEVDYKKFLNKERHQKVNWLEPYQFKNVFDTVGINRWRVWKSVI